MKVLKQETDGFSDSWQCVDVQVFGAFIKELSPKMYF